MELLSVLVVLPILCIEYKNHYMEKSFCTNTRQNTVHTDHKTKIQGTVHVHKLAIFRKESKTLSSCTCSCMEEGRGRCCV